MGRDPDRQRSTDDSGRGVAAPSTHRARRHAGQRLRPYTRYRLDESGRRGAITVRCPVCIGIAARESAAASVEYLSDFGLDLCLRRQSRCAAQIPDDSPSGIEQMKAFANHLANTPFHAISSHGFAQRPRGREADARALGRFRTCGIFPAKCYKTRAGHLEAPVVNDSEIGRPKEPTGLGETGLRRSRRVRLRRRHSP